ncbi:D-inositol-3-phosphate glycosyltransferase [Brevundimonas subvibrioides]|uniref:glycosyltransferase n=1 Tax=Brevundimonas subvibrioides TaxID=74313 RepID=UPI0032D57AFB
MSIDRTNRIVIVCPTLFANDAVGNAAAQLYRDLSADPINRVTMLVRSSGRSDTPVTVITTLTDLMYDDDFLRADVLIYIFAIYSDLFNVLLIGNGRAVQVIRFHNVTPLAFVAEKDRPLIDQSLRQLQAFHSADEIWADSQENIAELGRRGIAQEKCRLMPLGVKPLTRGRLTAKAGGTVRFVFVGRLVPSKGVDDLIEAAGILRRRDRFPFTVDVLGNMRHAPPAFIQGLKRRIIELGLSEVVALKGAVSNETLCDAYTAAHVFVTASHHEGFCVPVIEALAAGCVPVCYDNSNLRYIHGGLGRLAAEETPEALAEAMMEIGDSVSALWSGEPATLDVAQGPMTPDAFDAAADLYVAEFDPDTCARRVSARIDHLTSSTVARPA